MKLRRAILLFLITLLFTIFFGCQREIDLEDGNEPQNNEDEIIEETPEYGGEILVPITKVETLNPLLNKDRSMFYFNQLIYEGLFQIDNTYNVESVLAESYNIENNGQRIDVKLRNDVYWHDGERFTAEDVKFTLDVMKYGDFSSPYKEMFQTIFKYSNYKDLENSIDVQVVDDYNVTFIFDRSYGNALESLTFPIIPMHQFAQGGKVDKASYDRALSNENYKPNGTGPYRFESYDKLKSLKIEANKDWWKGEAYISTIQGQILGDGSLGEIAFESGQLDLAIPSGLDWDKFTQIERVKIYEFVSQNYEFIGVNLNKEIFQGEKGKAIRKAIAYGIDRQEIIQKVYLGHGTQVDVPMPTDSWLISEDANTYGFNVEKARSVLEEAGFRDDNSDGIYEDEEGKKLSLRLATNSYNDFRNNTANMISANLNNIGIEVIKDFSDIKPDSVDEEMLNTQWEGLKNKLSEGNFDLALLGWELSVIPDLSFAFHSSQIEGGTNFVGYQSEEMDQFISNAFGSRTREEKSKAYNSIQSLAVEDLPYISLFFKNSSLLMDRKIRGNINPLPYNIYYGIENWYIPKVYQKEK